MTDAVIEKPNIELWLEHWRDEADAAFLYRVLAGSEPSDHKKQIYLHLAEVEDHHVQLWAELLTNNGHPVQGSSRPSLRARILAWLGKRLGPAYLLPFLLREEGREVVGYLALHRESPQADARDTALTLAQESAAHAQTLGTLAGTIGEPWHRLGSGGHLRNIVYGFNDGLTANFGLVAGVVGADAGAHIVLVSGIAGLISDALSMGSSGYLAAKSHEEFIHHEIELEREEMRLMPEVEQEELAVIYEAKGVQADRARRMAAEVMLDREKALQEKIGTELGITEAFSTPLNEGLVTGAATAVGAFIPILPFLVLEGAPAMVVSFSISMVSHFAVGAARSFFTGRGIFRSGIDMLVVGLGVALVAYFIGDLVAKWLT